jgi:hypothetical protein
MVASKSQMVQILRGMIGDKYSYHNPLWYTDEELEDKLELALLRHTPSYSFSTLPRSQMMPICYRSAVDLCYELAARNAPFSVTSIEGMSVDKSGVMNNWLSLANIYKDSYLSEIRGGLGAEGNIIQGFLVRQSLTTGRQTPFFTARAFTPPQLSIVSISGRTITLSWTPIEDPDFFSFIIYRKTGTGSFEEVSNYYSPLDTTFSETLSVAGHYNYKVIARRGLTIARTVNAPFNLSATQYLDADSNIVSIQVL